MKKLPSLATYLLLTCAALTSQAQTAATPTPLERIVRMQPYVRCFGLDEELRAISSDARPKSLDPWREVKVGESSRRITVVAGTRLIYAYPDKVPFARMMVEQSEWSSYDEDVKTAQQALEDSTRTGDVKSLSFKLNGASAKNVTKSQIAGETLSRTELYFDSDHTMRHALHASAKTGSCSGKKSWRVRMQCGKTVAQTFHCLLPRVTSCPQFSVSQLQVQCEAPSNGLNRLYNNANQMPLTPMAIVSFQPFPVIYEGLPEVKCAAKTIIRVDPRTGSVGH